jgi:hypothetical protein
MAWALVVAVLVAAGLPLAAWWFSRDLKPAPYPLGRPGSRSDPVDRWLFGHYQLGMVDRAQVKKAVFNKGELPHQLALEQAARGLAVEVASGRLREPRGMRWMGWTVLVEGACLTTTLLALAVLKSPYALAGLFVTVQQLGLGWLGLREARRQRQRAQRLGDLSRTGSSDG